MIENCDEDVNRVSVQNLPFQIKNIKKFPFDDLQVILCPHHLNLVIDVIEIFNQQFHIVHEHQVIR
jgi:hypothetical protein